MCSIMYTVLPNHYTNYTKTKKYLTKLQISKNVRYNEGLPEVSDNTTNRKEYRFNEI